MDKLCRKEDEPILRQIQKVHAGTDKIIGFVYEATNYDQFEKLLGNREIDENNRKKLQQAMRIKQLPIPGVVNEKNQIEDGQTRLSVCKEEKLPFVFIVAPGLGIEDCLMANINAKNWGIKDILNRYAKTGNENYIRFVSLMEEFSVSDSIVMKATEVYFHKADQSARTKGGELIVSDEQYQIAHSRLQMAEILWETLNTKGKANKRQANIDAFLTCTKTPEFNYKRMLKACERASLDWLDVNKIVEIWKQIAPYYNKGRQSNYMDVVKRTKGNVPIFNSTENHF